MKKQTIVKELKEVDVVKSTEYFCDKCGKKIIRIRRCEDKNKIIIKRGESSAFNGGGWGEYDQAYFCNECSEEIKRILKNIGVKFEHVEYDY